MNQKSQRRPSKHPHTGITPALTSIIELIGISFLNDIWKTIWIPVAPLLAWVIVLIVNKLHREYKYSQLEKLFDKWIKEGESKLITCSSGEKPAIKKNIDAWQSELKEIQIERVGVGFRLDKR